MSANYAQQTPASAQGNGHDDALSQLQQHQQSTPPQLQQHQQQSQQHQPDPPQAYPYPSHHEQQSYDASPTDPSAEQPLQPSTDHGEGQTRVNRLRKACDSCSIRKVKCDEAGPPCRACAALEIPCTFERPSRRRGPPNKHAEAIKRRRFGSPGAFSSPSSPSNIAATLASFSSHAVLSAESICPFSTLELLIDDFFTYIHPLCPFPHEPSFRAAFKHREDLNNSSFLALLASMVGCLVASFPRKPRLHLKAQHREDLFPNSVSLVERCHKVAVEARGPGYLDRDLTVYDAATSYFLGLASAYTINWRQCRLYFGECLSISRTIGVHRTMDPSQYNIGSVATAMSASTGSEGQADEPVDYIRQEIGRRIFWCMFVGIRSMQQLGANFSELVIPPPSRHDPYPPLPLEVDDGYIYMSHVDPQPPGIISVIAGFNFNVQVYLTCTPITTMEMAYGIDEVFDWNRQKRILDECLRAVKKAVDSAPAQLLLIPGSQPGEFSPSRQYYPPAPEYPGMRGPANSPTMPQHTAAEDRRYLQYEIQKANIYVSQLGTRSYIVEKYWNLLDAHNNARIGSASARSSPGAIASNLDGVLATGGSNPKTSTGAYDIVQEQMTSEREVIVKDLLRVLSSISQINMEPNGGSFINKIRQIASTLLDTPRNRKGPLALRAEEYLGRFLDVLMKLEKIGPGPTNVAEGWGDDEDELRQWANLREFQSTFAKGEVS
ncbi:MAG: hypothetical protein M1818_000565 [Claussenomyces sp. TS43310]|nr:MAG: hypothetical protein M1818_000565 [Claussenomyces sp. TS43310]